MSLERYHGYAWLVCDNCERETDDVEGDRPEAEEQGIDEGWRVMPEDAPMAHLCWKCRTDDR